MVDITGKSRMELKEGSWDFSPVEQEIPLMIAGVAIPIGNKTESVLQTAALVSAEMQSAAAMESSML